MKMFKRFAAALLAGVMVLAMLTACGGGAGGPGESEFEKKVQDVYMTALNKDYGTECPITVKSRNWQQKH